MHGRGEIELRITGSQEAGQLARIEAVLRGIDPGSGVRHDTATGIVHVLTSADTLEVVSALQSAGFDPSGSSG